MAMRYREDLTKKIIRAIRNGASMSVIENDYGVKTEKTIEKWLDKYYTAKKTVARDVFAQLRSNNKVEKQSAAGKLEMLAGESCVTAEKGAENQPVVQFMTENSDVGTDTIKPKYDYLVDCKLRKEVMTKVKVWLDSKNATYKLFAGKPNCKAKLYGMPVVITDHIPYFYYLERDNVEYIHPDDLPVSIEEEIKAFEWSKDEKMPITKRRDGCSYASAKKIISYFSNTREIENPVTIYKNGHELKHDTIFFEEGDMMTFVTEKDDFCICWTFMFSDNKIREVGYKKGHKDFKAEMLPA